FLVFARAMRRRSQGCLRSRWTVPHAMRAEYEPALRANADQHLRAHVVSRGEIRRGQPWAGVSRFWLALRNPRCRRPGAQRGLEPVSAVARTADSARGRRDALQPPFRT